MLRGRRHPLELLLGAAHSRLALLDLVVQLLQLLLALLSRIRAAAEQTRLHSAQRKRRLALSLQPQDVDQLEQNV